MSLPLADTASQITPGAPEGMLILHHIGSAVKSIEQTLQSYPMFPRRSPVIAITSQKGNVCFVDVGNNVFLELVQPTAEDSPINAILEKRTAFYHLGFWTSEYDAAIDFLLSLRYAKLNTFHSEAFGGLRCTFLMSSSLHLIEVIERGSLEWATGLPPYPAYGAAGEPESA